MLADAWHDQQHAHMITAIRSHGWIVHYIGGDQCSNPNCDPEPSNEPPFAYTTGLFGLGHPELLIVGLDPETSAFVINRLAEIVKQGDTVMPGMLYSCEGWPHQIVPEPVPNPGDILFLSNEFYQRPDGHSVPALQLTYDDGAGRFPWDPGYADPDRQPRPGTFDAC